MISFLIGGILASTVTFALVRSHYRSESEVDNILYQELADKYKEYRQTYEIDRHHHEDTLKLNNMMRNKLLKYTVNGVYYNRNTDEMFMLTDEEIVYIGEL